MHEILEILFPYPIGVIICSFKLVILFIPTSQKTQAELDILNMCMSLLFLELINILKGTLSKKR